MGKLTKKDFTFKTEPLKHQLEALCQSATKTNFAYLMEMGCVDGETEFLSNRGWIKFKDFDVHNWVAPLLVAQCEHPAYSSYEAKQLISFAQPLSYIQKAVPKMIHFTGVVSGSTKPCLDVMVTPDHNMRCRMLYKDDVLATMEDDVTAEKLAEHINQRAEFAKTFSMQRGEILQKGLYLKSDLNHNTKLDQLSDAELRVLVAIMADGTFPRKDSDRCMLEFSKRDKIERFEMLCRQAGILAVRESIRGGKSIRFQLVAPAHKKVFDEDFWMLSPDKYAVIFDEVFYWDGSMEETRNRFYTIHKQSADFIQFVCFCQGYRTSISESVSNDAPYYTVTFNPNHAINDPGINQFTTVTKCEEINDIQTAYCFRMPAGQLILRRNDKIFVTGNSGKTKVIIDNMTYLKQKKAITGALVMAPKGVYRNWSTQEIPKHMPESVKPQILVWKSEASASYKNQLIEQIKAYDGSNFPILVFNIESLLSATGMDTINAFLKTHKGTVMGIIDESTCIKNHKAKRTKKALEIGQKCRVKRIATGSPITNSPLDLFSQFAFLDKQILGCGSFYAFRNVYAEIERITTRQGQSFDKILKYKNLPMLGRRIADFSYRITKKECLDLPDKIYVTRDVELTAEQKQLYNQIKQLSFAQPT